MTSKELAAELARIDAALDTAERERRWVDVAPARAEREALERQRQRAIESENRLQAVALSRKQESERQRLESESAALQARLEVWNSRIAELDEAARQLWPELADIEAAASANFRRVQAVGGDSHYKGYLCKAAQHARDGQGALRWRPGKL